MPRYQHIEHTSDLGLRIYGRDLPELYRNAAYAVFDNMLNLDAVSASESRIIELHSDNAEELFLDWLRELVFRFATEHFIVKEISQLEIQSADNTLRAEVRGERFDANRHHIRIEIKIPTYHMFALTQDKTGWQATVVFDV